MANYTLIRGWIECSFEDVSRLKEIVFAYWESAGNYSVDNESASLYRQGWIFPEKPLNWISVVFYGASIRSDAVPFLKSCLSTLAKSGLEISGIFYVDDEEEADLQLWSLSEQGLSEAKREGG
jgi:hypothetical protein